MTSRCAPRRSYPEVGGATVRRGFAYGSLPGQPLVPPVAGAGQRLVNRRYAAAARRLAG